MRRWAPFAIALMALAPLRTAQAQEATPRASAALLEFLADWETADGGWLDPALLDETGVLDPDPPPETPR